VSKKETTDSLVKIETLNTKTKKLKNTYHGDS